MLVVVVVLVVVLVADVARETLLMREESLLKAAWFVNLIIFLRLWIRDQDWILGCGGTDL